MALNPESTQIHLRKNQALRLRPGAAMTIRCTAGRVWITTTGQAADIILESGQTHIVRGYRLTLIEGVDEGWIRLKYIEAQTLWQRLGSLPGTCWQKAFSRTDRAASAPGWFA